MNETNNLDISILEHALKEFGLSLNEEQKNAFIKYYELLVEWNSFMNLTAITDFKEVCIKHFADSLSLCQAMDCTRTMQVIDIGTGAGFPGIPLKIMYPNMEIVLLDSLGKRVKFLNEVINVLHLDGIRAIHGRAEDYAKPDSLRESFDLCVSRAVANLSTLSEYCLPYVKVGGRFISYKSEKISEESVAAQHAISLLGGVIEQQKEFTLPESDIYRNLFIISKIKPTQKKYPRKAGLPAKEPLT